MLYLALTVISVLLGFQTNAQFDPQIQVLGNIVMSIGNHLFARFTDDEVPPGSKNGTFIEQVSYIHEMLLRMRDYFVNPPEYLKEQLRGLTHSFSFQVQIQLPRLNITEEDLRDKFHLNQEQIDKFQSMAENCTTFVDEIIATRGEEIPEKYL